MGEVTFTWKEKKGGCVQFWMENEIGLSKDWKKRVFMLITEKGVIGK